MRIGNPAEWFLQRNRWLSSLVPTWACLTEMAPRRICCIQVEVGKTLGSGSGFEDPVSADASGRDPTGTGAQHKKKKKYRMKSVNICAPCHPSGSVQVGQRHSMAVRAYRESGSGAVVRRRRRRRRDDLVGH